MKFQKVKGTRDFLPDEMVRRNYVLNTIIKTFENWGYQPFDTPIIETLKLLAAKGGGGEEIKKEIYYFKDQGGRELGLRYDLTTSTARVIAENLNLPKPFKRYQIGKVYRYDEPQSNRYREFLQADADIFGCDNLLADAEIIALTCNIFEKLGFDDFIVRLNNRCIIEDFVKGLGIKKCLMVFRAVDKLEKIGVNGVKEELKKMKIDEDKIKKIIKFIKQKGGNEILDKNEQLKGTKELKQILELIKLFGYEKNVLIDFSLVRGLDYYTGSVFEVCININLSLAGGGRFDKLIETLGGKPIPAVGIGLGFERIVETMKQRNMFDLPKTKIDAFVAPVNENLIKQSIDICNKLRKSNINCDMDLMNRKLSKQLEYASSINIPYVIIVGKKDLEQGKVTIRDMKTGNERTVSKEDVNKYIKINFN